MIDQDVSLEKRRQAAEAAWTVLPHGGRDSVRLRVHCAQGHHVAAVYDTEAGMVYVAVIGAHSHGDRDRYDELHRAHKPGHWFDLLDEAAYVDDALPAWCECGHRTLSRKALLTWMEAGEHRVVID